MKRSLSPSKPSTLHHPLWSQLQPSATPSDCERELSQVIPLRRLESLTAPAGWWHRDGHLPIASLQLAATVGSAVLIETQSQSQHWMLLAHDGSATLQHANGTCNLQPSTAVMLPGQSWTLISEDSSLTAIGFDPLHLLAEARAMAPAGWAPPPAPDSPLSGVLPIPREQDTFCSSLLAAIDLLLPTIGRVCQLGDSFVESLLLEQQLYRLIAALVFPNLHSQDAAPEADSRNTDSRLNRVLDYISLHLDQPLPLSVLEAQSNYCRRSLHYAFQQRFNCSPMQWIRQQRMALALQRLQNPRPGDSVRAAASAFGYRSMGRFSIDFQRAHNCKPSAVMRGQAMAEGGSSSSNTSSLVP